MTVLADFQTIIGDRAQTVDGNAPAEGVQLGQAFEAGGRISGNAEVGVGAAFLIYSVSNVTVAVDVLVNGQGPVGQIEATEPAVTGDEPFPHSVGWITQVITMAGSRLVSGQNRIQVRNTSNEDFFVKDLICFYHQDSD